MDTFYLGFLICVILTFLIVGVFFYTLTFDMNVETKHHTFNYSCANLKQKIDIESEQFWKISWYGELIEHYNSKCGDEP